jgi:hypothetical protein
MAFVHANDAAMGNLGYERHAEDFYATPADVTRAVLPFLLMHRDKWCQVWEPACGDGAMSEVLKEAFNDVFSTDLVLRGYAHAQQDSRDFLLENLPFPGIIVTNPPFGDLAEKFIRHALELTEEHRGVVAMLLRNEYDSASTRNDLFSRLPFARKVVLTWRPKWIADSTGSPRHNYSWFIWDWKWTREAVLSYALKGK